VILLGFRNLSTIAIDRYVERGGDYGIGWEGIQKDIRFSEFPIILSELKNAENLIFGKQTSREIQIKSQFSGYFRWNVHNTFAIYLLRYGLLGLFVFLLFLFNLYINVRKSYKILTKYTYNKKVINHYNHYWLLFQMFFYMFLISGIIGGHGKITIRGIVFILLGSIGGYFYKEAEKLRYSSLSHKPLLNNTFQ